MEFNEMLASGHSEDAVRPKLTKLLLGAKGMSQGRPKRQATTVLLNQM